MLHFDQMEPLGELHVRWVGGDTGAPGAAIDEYGDEPDQETGPPPGEERE
jgi:hypothetical protein